MPDRVSIRRRAASRRPRRAATTIGRRRRVERGIQCLTGKIRMMILARGPELAALSR
jgi:hypothetical protein